jgi:hypothetical protein
MEFLVNNVVATAYYSSISEFSTLSKAFLEKLSISDTDLCVLQINVLARSLTSPQIVDLPLTVEVNRNVQSCDLLLGRDWYALSLPYFRGQEVRYENQVLRYPLLSTERFSLHAMRAHAGYSRSCDVVKKTESSTSPLSKQVVSSPVSGLYLLEESLSGNLSQGARTSVFTESFEALNLLCSLHGIDSEDQSSESCRNALIRHYISGNCHTNACQKRSHRRRSSKPSVVEEKIELRDMSTCANVSKSYDSCSSLSSAILRFIVDSQELTTPQLLQICLALGISISPCSYPSRSISSQRHRLLRFASRFSCGSEIRRKPWIRHRTLH